MPKYLAVDFGTTNCLAAWVDADKKSSLIPLDGNSPILPSAISSKFIEPIPKIISEVDFQRGLKEAKEQELLRLNNQETDIKSQLRLFRKQHGPRRKAPEQSEFRNIYKFQEALDDYNLGMPTLQRESRASKPKTFQQKNENCVRCSFQRWAMKI